MIYKIFGMQEFSMPLQVRWADIDANNHLRHSVYYDWGAACRIAFLNQQGLTMERMHQLHFGPVLLREECVFRKEVRLQDSVSINLEIVWARKDFTRWSIRHQITKKTDIPCAIITVEGAWIDTLKRKLAGPLPEAIEVFSQMPISRDFEWRN